MRLTESPELVCAIDPVTSSTSMTSTFEISSFAVQLADRRNSSLPNMNINSVGNTADACPTTSDAPSASDEKRMPDAPYLASGKLKLNILSASACAAAVYVAPPIAPRPPSPPHSPDPH